jgi:hypothetical protein
LNQARGAAGYLRETKRLFVRSHWLHTCSVTFGQVRTDTATSPNFPSQNPSNLIRRQPAVEGGLAASLLTFCHFVINDRALSEGVASYAQAHLTRYVAVLHVVATKPMASREGS